MKRFLPLIGILLGLVWSCKTIYVPAETATTVNVIDSVAIRYLDSIRVTELWKVRNYAWKDTLFLVGNRSRAWAAIDSTRELDILVGELEEDAVEEHTKVIWRDKVKYRDSIQVERVPYPVEVPVEKKVTPKLYPWSLALNLVFILLILGYAYIKVKGIGRRRV